VDGVGGSRRDAFEATLAGDDELQRYAAFRASVESHQWTWEGWPERARGGVLKPGVDYDGETFRYHAYAQWLARIQVAAAADASRAGLYLDLPLGSHGGGYDTWRHPRDFALGVSAGAPPDNVFEGGQNWAFPPLHPERARASVYAPLRAALRHHFEHASVLRVDHVMGLHRLFWIPSGFSGGDGVYVRSHARELWSILAIEAARARGGRGAAVVGEDLGTVPDEVRHEMNTRGALRMFVLPFEQQEWQEPPLRTPPADALACTGTHDMEPFAAWWTGLGDRRARLAAFLGCDNDDPALALGAALAWLARSDASIVLASLEDLWLETQRQNMPGTVSAAGNWQRPFALSYEEFTSDAGVTRLVALLREARATFPSPTIAAARSPA
jgi:4-alpha-glucanotransferase